MLRIASPLAWTKIWFLAASHFCKPRVSICLCHMVYFAYSPHIEEPRCIARYFALIHVLQNLHEPSASNSSCDNKQPIFAQIYKQWLFLSSIAHSRSLYFAAAYRLAIIRLTCKNQKWDTFQQATTNVYKKAKSKILKPKKIDAAHNDHIFYLAATAHASFRHLQFFAVARESKAHSFAATQQKSVFIIYIMLMFTLVHFVWYSIAISTIILRKVNARL